MAGGGAGKTTAGNLRRAKLSDVCSQVTHSWEYIQDEIIIESFKSCGISTNLDSDLEITDEKDSDIDDISDNINDSEHSSNDSEIGSDDNENHVM